MSRRELRCGECGRVLRGPGHVVCRFGEGERDTWWARCALCVERWNVRAEALADPVDHEALDEAWEQAARAEG